jgi:hypothetical protein
LQEAPFRFFIAGLSCSFGFVMPDPKSRLRVERLLRGDLRPDDLTNLFIFARDHCDGCESVVDIGDFVAPHSERNRGIVTRSTREWFATARYHAAALRPKGPPQFDGGKLPPVAQEYFKIAVNAMDSRIIRERTGLRRAAAYNTMLSVAKRLNKNADGTWALPADLSKDEAALVDCVSTVMVVKAAFDANRLVEDFLATLKSNGLITKDELRQHAKAIGIFVQLFAISVMHNCVVQIADGTTVQLKAKAEKDAKRIDVNAPIQNAFPHVPGVLLATSMFTVNLDPAVHCHPNLLAGDWDFEIEFAPEGLLSRLR